MIQAEKLKVMGMGENGDRVLKVKGDNDRERGGIDCDQGNPGV